jgi:hypothetical protein
MAIVSHSSAHSAAECKPHCDDGTLGELGCQTEVEFRSWLPTSRGGSREREVACGEVGRKWRSGRRAPHGQHARAGRFDLLSRDLCRSPRDISLRRRSLV